MTQRIAEQEKRERAKKANGAKPVKSRTASRITNGGLFPQGYRETGYFPRLLKDNINGILMILAGASNAPFSQGSWLARRPRWTRLRSASRLRRRREKKSIAGNM